MLARVSRTPRARAALAAALHASPAAAAPPTLDGGDADTGADAYPATPWVRSVISGVDLMRNPKYNKGLAFSDEERDRLHLRGLLPPAVLPQATQAARAMVNVRSKAADLDRLTYLTSLQERNERLFHRVLADHIEELLPVWGEPTLSAACAAHGLMFRALPRALFVSASDAGSVYRILKNWPERRVKVLCVTDGARVGGLGDLGVQAVGAPVSRLALYSAVGGVDPSVCLPVCIDAGTDNPDLLSSPFYVGARRPRAPPDVAAALVDELLAAARARYGASLFIDFDCMAPHALDAAFAAHRGSLPVYSDAVQGTGAVVLAAVLAAARATGKGVADHTYLFVGDGPAAVAAADIVAEAIARAPGARSTTILDARARVWLADSRGLVTRARADADGAPDHFLPYAHDAPPADGLLAAVAAVKPSVLVGVSGGGACVVPFSREVLAEVAAAHAAPIVLALSTPGEVAAADAYEWTGGRALFADRSRPGAPPVTLSDGTVRRPGNAHPAFIFPGLGFGSLAARATRLRDEGVIAAAEAVAACVSDADLEAGALFPPLSDLAAVGARVACAVARRHYDSGTATELPKPADLGAHLRRIAYSPTYRRYR